MADPWTDLEGSILKILHDPQTDLSQVSAKKIRRTLIQDIHYDEAWIKENKQRIDSHILHAYQAVLEQQHEKPESESEDEPLASSSQRSVGELRSADAKSGDVKSRVEQSSRSPLESDEAMARRLQASFTARPRRTTASVVKKRSKAKKRPARSSDFVIDDGETTPKKTRMGPNNGFNAPMVLSPELAHFVGQDELSRPQIVKSIWDYVKANELQLEGDRRYIRIDESLRPIFPTGETVHMFTLNKIISKHVKAKGEVVSKYETKVEEDTLGDTERREMSGSSLQTSSKRRIMDDSEESD